MSKTSQRKTLQDSDNESVVSVNSTDIQTLIKKSTKFNLKRLTYYQTKKYRNGERKQYCVSKPREECSFGEVNWRELVSSIANNIVTFRVSQDFHYLHSVYMTQKFPEVSVKPEYKDRIQICYPKFTAHNTWTEAIFTVGKTTFRLDPYCMDAFYQYYIENKPQYELEVGDKESIRQWSDKIEAFIYKAYHPWPMHFGRSKGIPLFFFNCIERPDLVYFTYTLKNKISSILRMRQLKDDGSYENIPFNEEYIVKPENGGTLETPTLTGKYSIQLDDEIRNLIQDDDGTKHPYSVSYTCYDPYECFDSIDCGSEKEIQIKHDKPIKAVYFSLQNREFEKCGACSIYTLSDDDDDEDSKTPFETISVNYGLTSLRNQDPLVFKNNDANNSSSLNHGFYCFASCFKVFSNDPDVGVVFTKRDGSIKFKVRGAPSGTVYKLKCCVVYETIAEFSVGECREWEHTKSSSASES